MFRIDNVTNSITKLNDVRFSDLGFTERAHLQEWLAKQPNALGEELLVIQKEFAGFDDTKERLDLLALDKYGALVIIENKLDDSGRDVVWQGLKYASYCSTLSKTSIAGMYQQYLDQGKTSGNAEERICEFLGYEDFSEVNLNVGNDQRLILVAARFRKEVTSTVLWLLKHGIRTQCFKVTPYKLDKEFLLNLEQVIPLPEAEDLMIGIAEKEKEEHSVEQGQAAIHILRREFWDMTLEALEKAGVDLYANVSTSRDHWLSAGSGLAGVHYSMIFVKDGVRVEFVMARSKEKNKALFDYLFERRAELENKFGHELEWRKLEDKKVSIIVTGATFNGYDKDDWPKMIEWLVLNVPRMETTFEPHIPALRQLLKTKFPNG